MCRARPIVLIILIALGAARVALRAQNPIQPLPDALTARDPLTPAPARAQGEGFGPYATLVVRGAMLIDGTGGPPRGPVAIVATQNRITPIRNPGTPGLPLRAHPSPNPAYNTAPR